MPKFLKRAQVRVEMLQTGASGILRGRCAGAQEPGAGSELCQRGAVGSGGSQHGQGSPPSPWKEAVAGGEQQVLEVSVPASLQKKGEGEKRSSPGPGRGRMLQPGRWVVSCLRHCLRLRAGDKESRWRLPSECCHLLIWQWAPQKPACLLCGLTLARRWLFVGDSKATSQMAWLRTPGCFQP